MGRPYAFSRLCSKIKKKWYKLKIHRASRKRLRQSRDIENHQDKRLDPWSLD